MTPPDRIRYKRTPPTPGRVCKDCLAETPITRLRPAPHPGPRCHTHHLAARKTRRLAAKEARIERMYDLSPEEYDALYAAQGGRCYICRRARGTGRKRLAVDHDHELARRHPHPDNQGCKECARGLLCQRCNHDILGHLRDDPAALHRAIEYLRSPPWQRLRSSRMYS